MSEMVEKQDGLYPDELRRWNQFVTSGDESAEVRLTVSRNFPWSVYLTTWLVSEPKGTPHLACALMPTEMRSLAQALLIEAGRIEREWAAIGDDERARWSKRVTFHPLPPTEPTP